MVSGRGEIWNEDVRTGVSISSMCDSIGKWNVNTMLNHRFQENFYKVHLLLDISIPILNDACNYGFSAQRQYYFR